MLGLPFTLARELPRRIRLVSPQFAPFRFASSAAALKKPPPPSREESAYDDEPVAVASGSRTSAHDNFAERYEPTEDDQAAAFPAWEEMESELALLQQSQEELSTNWQKDHSHFDVIAEEESVASSSRWGSEDDVREVTPSPTRTVTKRKIVPFGSITTPLPSRVTLVRPPRDTPKPSVDIKGRRKRVPKFPERKVSKLVTPIRPFVPFGFPTYDPIQPHEIPLTSRNDWRLSSPLTRLHRDLKVKPPPPKLSILSKFKDPPIVPPSLWFARAGFPNSALQGMNRLVGVGLEPSEEGNRWAKDSHEKWGWKTPVPESEKGEWIALDEWRKGPDRLISLTREADERAHQEFLRRQGTPVERFRKGRTILGAVGEWVKESAKTIETRKNGDSTRAPPAISIWRMDEVGAEIGPDGHGSKFKVGDLLRFTPTNTTDPTGPQPPPPASNSDPQGTLLEIKNGTMRVAFEGHWSIDDSLYRIDQGMDNRALILQTRALDNLFHDPIAQRRFNEKAILTAQDALLSGVQARVKVTGWALQGTSLRELIVPKLEAQAASTLPLDELEDDSPAVELSRIPIPTLPIIDHEKQNTTSNPSTLFSQNQLINSWIKRHDRKNPLTMPGDPELGLNDSQTRAVAMALSQSLSLIQGPPGTGKSQTIVSIIHLLKSHFRVPYPILLSTPTHVSSDHLLSLLVKRKLNPLRIGRPEKVREEFRKWTIIERAEMHPMSKGLGEARVDSEKARVELSDWKEHLEKKKNRTPKDDAVTLELTVLYKKAWSKVFSLEQRLFASMLSSADVFLSTCIGASTNRIMDNIDFPIVFIDEAAMCTEPVTLIPIMKGSCHVTLIGDHMQLPAIVTSRIAQKERLHVSLFERLMTTQAVRTVLLDTQYRMRPCISAFPNQAFYHTALKDSPTVTARSSPPKCRFYAKQPSEEGFEPTTFLSHRHPESKYFQSTINAEEVSIIVDLVGDLLHKNPTLEASDIGIISPYAAQTRLLDEEFKLRAPSALERLLGSHRASEVDRVEINTVDGFQGREKLIIILSTVRSNKSGHIGFLTDKRRLNVALTRAQDALFVVGNESTLSMATLSDWKPVDVDADPSVWRRYLAWLSKHGLVKKV